MKPRSIYSTMLRTEYRFDNIREAIWWAIALRLKGIPAFRQGTLVFTNDSQPVLEI